MNGWAFIIPLALMLAGILLLQLGHAAAEDDPAGALYLAKLRKEAELEAVGVWAQLCHVAERHDTAVELRALGLTRAAWMISAGPILILVGAVLGVVSTAAVLTVG